METAYVAANGVPIRRLEDVESELWEIERALEARRFGVESARHAVAREIEESHVTHRALRRMERGEADRGVCATYGVRDRVRERREQSAELSALLAEQRELRRQRALWTRRVPVGMVEIAELLGYSADTPRQWKRRATLPAPTGHVSGTPYWWRPDVLRWALEHDRTRAILPADEHDDDATAADHLEEIA